jgi:hydrogenase expression/formation protein HypE
MTKPNPSPATDFAPQCPIKIADYPRVLLAHGGGGRLMHQLIDKMFAKAFANPHQEIRHDGATLAIDGARLAFTTDSYVVHPLFFPGGDIGKMAVCGAVNDLAMCGARPLYLSAGMILEEGLEMETLWRIVRSMQATAAEAGVEIVTGDTKVVERGKGDGIFINTAGIGAIVSPSPIGPAAVRPGDAILLSGDVGRHGIAIMAEREGLAFETPIESDCAPLGGLVGALLASGVDVHCLRDLTRGGLAGALVEIAGVAGLELRVDESAIRVREQVRGACELLGLDPLYVANEGRMIAFVAPEHAERAAAAMRSHPLGLGTQILGRASEETSGRVHMRTSLGTTRVLDMLSGEQLPRIC